MSRQPRRLIPIGLSLAGSGGRRASALGRILGRLSWTITDQSLLGASNFAATLLLARWLPPAEFGGYVAASAIFWMVTSAYSGLVTEPMMVFSAGRFSDDVPAYFGVLVLLNVCVSLIIVAGLAAGGGLLIVVGGSLRVGLAVLGYALATPAILLLAMLRRAVYAYSRPQRAAVAAGIYMVALIALIYVCHRADQLSALTAPMTAAGASLLAAAGVFRRNRSQFRGPRQRGLIWNVMVAHWEYGRWAVVSGALTWVPACFYYLIMPVFVGLGANGALRALMTLVLPANQINNAMTLLLLPAFGRVRGDGRAPRLLWTNLCLLVGASSLYALVIALFAGALMDLFYGGLYNQYADVAWLVGLTAVPTAATAVLGSWLRANERPDRVLGAYVASTVSTFGFGVLAVALWGVFGAVIGLLMGYATTSVVMLWWAARMPRDEMRVLAVTRPG